MNVVIVGTGYVGLVSGVCFADFGHSVTCVDKNPSKIETLNSGGVPIYEPGLDILIQQNAQAGRLQFSTDLKKSMKNADVVFIADGTPTRPEDGFADLTYVYAAAEEIAQNIEDFTVVVNKSTVPVGTGEEVASILAKSCAADQFAVVSNPEFLREGAAINDFKFPDRVVIGVENKRAEDRMRELYRPLAINDTPLLITTIKTSELIKYAANAFLATKITYINEIADLCEQIGADVASVSEGIGLDDRIGPRFLNAGPGYGGSCFPKDTIALVRSAQKVGVDLKIVESVVQSNDRRKIAMAEKIIGAMGGDIKNKNIAVLGLAFKPGTDDMRDAPSVTIIKKLLDNGAKVTAYDPEAMDEARDLLPDISYADEIYSCIEKADCLVIITEWDQFRALDLQRIKSLLKTPLVVDLRNIYDEKIMSKAGLSYVCIGRNSNLA